MNKIIYFFTTFWREVVFITGLLIAGLLLTTRSNFELWSVGIALIFSSLLLLRRTLHKFSDTTSKWMVISFRTIKVAEYQKTKQIPSGAEATGVMVEFKIKHRIRMFYSRQSAEEYIEKYVKPLRPLGYILGKVTDINYKGQPIKGDTDVI